MGSQSIVASRLRELKVQEWSHEIDPLVFTDNWHYFEAFSPGRMMWSSSGTHAIVHGENVKSGYNKGMFWDDVMRMVDGGFSRCDVKECYLCRKAKYKKKGKR